ncbi:hypothetical protein RQN30_06675 [Arcanobacterium hippocoleae]
MDKRSEMMRSMRRMLRNPFNAVVLALVMWFIAAFLLLPAINVLISAFTVEGM